MTVKFSCFSCVWQVVRMSQACFECVSGVCVSGVSIPGVCLRTLSTDAMAWCTSWMRRISSCCTSRRFAIARVLMRVKDTVRFAWLNPSTLFCSASISRLVVAREDTIDWSTGDLGGRARGGVGVRVVQRGERDGRGIVGCGSVGCGVCSVEGGVWGGRWGQ